MDIGTGPKDGYGDTAGSLGLSGYILDMERRYMSASRPTELLRRVVEISRRVVRGLWTLAVAAAVCVSIAWVVWLVDTPARGAEGWVGRFVALAVLLMPSAVLLLFVSGLRELGRLAEKVRALSVDVRPGIASHHATEPGGRRGLLAALFRLARLVWGSRDVLSPYAAVSIALRPAILLAALAAAAAAALEVPAALLAIVIMSVA